STARSSAGASTSTASRSLDVSLPETMKRSMARQAEADRERRARVINADAELQASKKLAEAAAQMSETPSALQLRLLQTVMAVAAEKNSTLVLPIPVELLRFLERGQQPPEAARANGGGAKEPVSAGQSAAQEAAPPAAQEAVPPAPAVPRLTEREPEREPKHESERVVER
ncbi:LOW QUALITY PROTEIN: SPFH/Band 7 domain protein, partial [Streptomyces himastatinicus ATCC 53653]